MSLPRRSTFFALLLVAALCAPAQALAALITSASDAALSGALVQTFDAAATGDFSDRTFLIGGDGFTITPVSSTLRIGGNWCDDFGTTGNCLETYSSSTGSNDEFDVVFTGAGVSAFGFDVTALDTDWTIETYDENDVLLGTYTVLSQSPTLSGFDRRGYFGATETSAIQRFTVRSSGADYALIDNVAYVPTPEPGTGVLAGLGLMGLAWAGRPTRR
ncbi:MAG: PEP-CTERM sorting domain-containing protein [Myxococcota bacterium]